MSEAMLPSTRATTRPAVQPVLAASWGGVAGGRAPGDGVPGGISLMEAREFSSPLRLPPVQALRPRRGYPHTRRNSHAWYLALMGRVAQPHQHHQPRHRSPSVYGLDVPEYEAVCSRLARHPQSHFDPWREWAGAWNGLAYRWRPSRSLRAPGPGAPPASGAYPSTRALSSSTRP